MSNGRAIFDSGLGARERSRAEREASVRREELRAGWPKVIDEAYGGDPFNLLIEAWGQRYVLDEAVFIEMEHDLKPPWLG